MSIIPSQGHVGRVRTRPYAIWDRMISRCHRPNDRAYRYYGSRGIKVCDEWRNDFYSFLAWCRTSGYADNLEIDRFPDKDGDYEPSNCRWVTHAENMRNTRRNRYHEAFGETKCVSEWSRDPRCAVNLVTLNSRLRNGWDFFQALTTPAASVRGADGRVRGADGRFHRHHGRT